MKSSNKNELLSQKQRLEALIAHIKGGGGQTYDSAHAHVFYEKPCPAKLAKKTSSDFLAEYESALQAVNDELDNFKFLCFF